MFDDKLTIIMKYFERRQENEEEKKESKSK